MSLRALRSDQKAAGIGASSDSAFCVTSLAFVAPGITETTIGWASTNCSAAARISSWVVHV